MKLLFKTWTPAAWAVAGLVALHAPAVDAAPGHAYAAPGDKVTLCSWDRPGHDRYTGDAAAALSHYPDIPVDVRQRLRERMDSHDYDDVALITRDAIAGRRGYQPDIREMHFGARRVCKEVSRANWTAAMRERGLVYCDSGHCILVPSVCNNVSRIARRPEAVAPEHVQAGGDAPVAVAPPPVPAEASSGQSFEDAVAGPLGAPGAGRRADASGPYGALGPYFIPGAPGAAGGGGFLRAPSRQPEPPSLLPPEGGPPLPPIIGGPGGPVPLPPGISAVPEPKGWLLMTAGLALLAWRVQRRAGVPRWATQKRS